jgi:hypothetical protein
MALNHCFALLKQAGASGSLRLSADSFLNFQAAICLKGQMGE